MKNINIAIRTIPASIIIKTMKHKFESSAHFHVRKVYIEFSEAVGKLIIKL
jgi:hypothetical protein